MYEKTDSTRTGGVCAGAIGWTAQRISPSAFVHHRLGHTPTTCSHLGWEILAETNSSIVIVVAVTGLLTALATTTQLRTNDITSNTDQRQW